MNDRPPLPLPPARGHVAILLAAEPGYVAVYVEGPSDVSMWKPWLHWEPIPAYGKPAVLGAIEALRNGGTGAYFGIVDADFDRVECALRPEADILFSEAHDLECDLVRSPVMSRFLASVKNERLASLLPAGMSLCDALLERALPFGVVRWLYHKKKTAYPQGRLSPWQFVDRRTWQLDERGLVRESALALGELEKSIAEEIKRLVGGSTIDPWQVCNGHDLVTLLAIALRGPLECQQYYRNDDSVANGLRLSVDSSHLPTLAVWRGVKAWESTKSQIRLCKC